MYERCPAIRTIVVAFVSGLIVTACGGGGGSDSAQVITPTNEVPVANAGADVITATGQSISLSGAAYDADGDQLFYAWSFAYQPPGSNAQLSNPFRRTVSFTPDVDGMYQLRLAVFDGTDYSTPDNVLVSSIGADEPPAPPPPATGPTPEEPPVEEPPAEEPPLEEPPLEEPPVEEPPVVEPPVEEPPVAEPPTEELPGTAPAPLANSYAGAVATFTDNFANGNPANAAHETAFWSIAAGSGATVAENGGQLILTSVSNAASSAAVRSQPDYRFNFFNQPLQFQLNGLSFEGTAANTWQKKVRLSITSAAGSERSAADAVVLSAQQNGRIRLSWKVDAPSADTETTYTLLDRDIGVAPVALRLIIDQTSYRVSVQTASGSYSWSGWHAIPKAAWGRRGDSAINIDGLRNDGNADNSSAVVRVGSLDVQSLAFFDDFSNALLTDTGNRRRFWQSSGSANVSMAETDDRLTISATGGNTTQSGWVLSPVSKDFNFLGQDLIFSGRVELSGNMGASAQNLARFGISSSAQLPWSAADAVAVTISADRRVRLGSKTNLPNQPAETSNTLVNAVVAQVPNNFELRLNRQSYVLTVYWQGGQQTWSGSHGIVWHQWDSYGDASISLAGHRNSTAANDLAITRWDGLAVTRYQPYYMGATVFGPVGDGISLEVPELGTAHPLAQWGMLDVTRAPFNADPTGASDSTEALQHAINFAREHAMVAWFPEGTYLVSDTLSCAQDLFVRTTGELTSKREEGPCVLMGSRAGPRPRVVLAANAPGFGDPGNGKPVIHLWARSYFGDPEKSQPNIAINQMLVNIDLEIRDGNPGAIGISNQGAQGSGVQESTINVGGGLAGLQGGAGSGGSHADITVIGGEVGLDLNAGEPNPTIVGMTLIGQRRNAIYYMGPQSLTAVGLKIELGPTASTAIQVPTMTGSWSAVYGQVTLVDSSIDFPTARAGNRAVAAGRSVFLQDVYVRGAGNAVVAADGATLPASLSGWTRVIEYAHGIRPPAFTGYDSNSTVQYESPRYANGVRTNTDLVNVDQNAAPPADLQSKHLWTSNFPGWESAGAVNVMASPYGAKGDGVTDDRAAIQAAIDANPNGVVFLPKGYYRITAPLQLRANTRLIGLARNLTNIVASGTGSFGSAANPQPVLRTVNSATAAPVVAFLGLHAPIDLPGAYTVLWQSGQNSISRDVNIISRSAYGYAGAPGKPNPPDTNNPLTIISGNGGGKWYNFYQETHWKQGPGYRHLLVSGTTQPLNFYQVNPEHAQSDANMEIRGARNVNLFGLKSEGNFASLWIRDSDYINVYGFGGNGSAFAATDGYPDNGGYNTSYTPSLIRVERTPNFRLVNIVDYGRMAGSHPVFGAGTAPDQWHAIVEIPAQTEIRSAVLDRPVLYKRAN